MELRYRKSIRYLYGQYAADRHRKIGSWDKLFKITTEIVYNHKKKGVFMIRQYRLRYYNFRLVIAFTAYFHRGAAGGK